MPSTQRPAPSLRSEKDAWTLLEWLLNDPENSTQVEFDGWPIISMKIEGERYAATLPTGLMRQVSEIQGVINRCYGRAAYQRDARSVKQSERDGIELIFEVSEGSTELKADATGLLDRLGDAMKKPSTANKAAITIVALALIISGSIVLSSLSDHRLAIEEKRLELLAKAIERAPDLKDATPEFQKVYRDIVASASDADQITVGTSSLPMTEISAIAGAQRATGQRIDIAGLYKVDAIRRFSKHCLVDVILPSGEKIRARIVFDRFPEADISAVLMAVAKNTPIKLSVTAMKHKDGYSSARITAIGA
ncbi:MAG: hypothetical protein JNK06_10825 [Candidatus Accumulibacter phosphatis]|uniref:hypothetical protein n=1 Tax=Candidatus Accumulibacter phosphatis TaxID=327160 RepID=UPI001A57007A|nr:hypothetical protein [Candidatus Accumulibacter phosphatis]